MAKVEISTASKVETISERYERIQGFTSGFDYMRLALAAAVVFQHSLFSTYGVNVHYSSGWNIVQRVFFTPILLMFFSLSGFLVSGSLRKNSKLSAFVTLRAIRLVPALAVEVLLSALVLGPLFTNWNLVDYFAHKSFWIYFLNMVGLIHYSLPGVFTDTPVHDIVNISLWTVPYELECYLVLIALWMTGVLKNRWILLAITLLLTVVGTALDFGVSDPSDFGFNPPRARALVVAFMFGIVLKHFSDKIKLNWKWASVAVLVLALATTQGKYIYIAALFSAYIVVYLGMMNPPKRTFLLRGDYSYGLYLFAFPIQQAYSYLFPTYRFWPLNFAFAMVFGLTYASFSWHLIEKPLLSRKKNAVDFVSKIASTMLSVIRPKSG